MKRTTRRIAGFLLVMGIVGCGKSPSRPSTNPPVSNPPPAPPAVNRNPVINSMTVTPSFAVSQLTAISMAASGTDPDGDPVTFD